MVSPSIGLHVLLPTLPITYVMHTHTYSCMHTHMDVRTYAHVRSSPATTAEPVESEVLGAQGAGTGTLEQDPNRLPEYRIPSYSRFKVYSMYSEAFYMLPWSCIYSSVLLLLSLTNMHIHFTQLQPPTLE